MIMAAVSPGYPGGYPGAGNAERSAADQTRPLAVPRGPDNAQRFVMPSGGRLQGPLTCRTHVVAGMRDNRRMSPQHVTARQAGRAPRKGATPASAGAEGTGAEG